MNRTLTHTTPARTKRARITVAALSAAAVAVTIGAISLAGPASAHRHTGSTTKHYVLHDGQFAMDDLGKPGEGLGDILVQSQPVTQHGKTVGHVHDTATAVAPKGNLWQANGSLVLHGGTIEYAGLVSHTPHFTVAITGGTGTYQGASGQMTFDFPGNRQLLTVSLKP